MELATKSDLEVWKNEILLALNKQPGVEKIIVDLNEVMYMTGMSKTTIRKLITDGKLTPWQEKNKLLFYANEVRQLVPAVIRRKVELSEAAQ